jgi:hypothetical protein
MLADLAPLISSALAQEVQLHARGDGEAQVEVPFYFPDGDGLVVYIRQMPDGRYEVTDKAHTLLHLSYHLDIGRLRDGTRANVLEQIRLRHGLDDREGELVRPAVTRAEIGHAVFNFVQALLQVSDIRMLERDIVRSTFREDLEQLILERFPTAQQDYTDAEHDPDGRYPIDYVLNGVKRPVAVFGVAGEESALKALVIAEKWQSWRRPLRLVAVEDEQQKLGRTTVAWLSDNFDKQFSTLHGNEEGVVAYLEAELEDARRLSESSD